MTERVDVVVVGGGVIGASTAFHLARLGAGRVTLVEKSRVAAGASGRSGALVRTHYTNPHEARLAVAALPWFEDWQERVGGDCGFVRTGFLQLVSPSDADRLRENVAMLQAVGAATKLVSADQIRQLQPELVVDDDELAAFEPKSGYADPVATTASLVRAAVGRGVKFEEGTEVTEIEVVGGHVAGVVTSTGRITTSAVVLANGAWSRLLLDSLGIRLPIHPTRVQVAFFQRPAALRRGADGHMTMIDRRFGYYTRPYGEDGTLLGLSAYHRPLSSLDDFPRSNDPEFPALALRQLAARIPAFAGSQYRRGHTGPIDATDDGKAILDRAPGIEGLFLAVGMSGTGFKKSPAIGSCMAELVTAGEASTAPIHPFRLSRFAEGDLIGGVDYSLPAEAVDQREGEVLRGRGLVH